MVKDLCKEGPVNFVVPRSTSISPESNQKRLKIYKKRQSILKNKNKNNVSPPQYPKNIIESQQSHAFIQRFQNAYLDSIPFTILTKAKGGK